ncbi:MAG: flagellar hook protein FlgE [Gammaproteobacteria bacterium]|nr:flagellar hook protein FlgE [Sideroxydans sp.]MBU3904329.1 flagellar hook protein FlgE [Gammaproteobacteria bacterium]MBU4150898.1 flagellar hook protein FlgE [Gammaproteobacteria bacterium]
MGFQQGLSGLNAAAKNLDVIGNNVANASTVGFKGAQAQFADVYASSIGGGTAAGIGTRVAAIAQQFTQGNITTTNNSLDMAISGNGFFRLSDNGSIVYSRNGQFQMDKDGYIVTTQGHRLTGFLPNTAGVIVATAPAEIQISTADLLPKATAAVTAGLNLDSRSAIIPAAPAFDPNNSATYSNSTSMTVYDSLGSSHVASLFFAKTATNTWNAYLTVDGVNPQAANAPLTAMTFDTNGVLTAPAAAVTSTAFTPAGATAQTLSFDFASTSQFGGLFGVNSLTQDGYTSGRLTGFSTGADGTIAGRYSNGQSKTLGQVVLSNFSNPQGLQPLGGNNWAETNTSGTPLTGSPGSSSLGVLQTSAVEDSNVDLTAELVNMITAQRVYQANAQSVKTQDQVLQTIVNLR